MENIVQGQWFSGPSADLGDPIDQSLRFNPTGAAVTYLENTNISIQATSTASMWIKLGGEPAAVRGAIFGASKQSTSADNATALAWKNDSTFISRNTAGEQAFDTAKYRDYSGWYHLVLQFNSSLGTTLFVNGTQQSSTLGAINTGSEIIIGRNRGDSADEAFQGYIADVRYVDGQILAATEFARYNEDGVWVPQNYTGSYGTNGFHLTFDSSQTNGIGHDSSGNDNHFTASGFDEYINDVNVYFPVTGTASTAALGTTLRGTTPNGNGGTGITVNSTNHMDVDFGRSATSHTLTITNSGGGVTIYVSPDGTENSWIASNVTNTSFTSGQTITANDNSAFRYLRFTCSSYNVNNVTAPVGGFSLI